jgi:energy-converting hydrogenase Eha subunit B
MKIAPNVAVVATMVAAIVGGAVPARALPGQSAPQLMAWMNGNAPLRGYSTRHDEMSGATAYSKTVRIAGATFAFGAIAGNGVKSYDETFGVLGASQSYDLRKHRGVAAAMVQAVYGKAVAADLTLAPTVGDFGIFQTNLRVTILRGKRYGYSLAGSSLTVFPVAGVASAVRQAKVCATQSCGD